MFPGQGSLKPDEIPSMNGDNVQILTSSVTLMSAQKFMFEKKDAEFIGVGHSLGEFAMLTAAGVFTPVDLVNILDIRTKAMQKACHAYPGSMCAIIGADPAVIRKVCHEISIQTEQYVNAVNFNSDVQTVISGENLAVKKAAEVLMKMEHRVVKLEVSGAFHTPLMESAAAEIRDFLADKTFPKPSFPLYSTYTGKLFSDEDLENLAEYLYNQMINPVLFTDAIRAIKKDYPDITFFEPGKTLTGLVRKIKI
jgi:[acyl-carrier-protein] S-malonyltransferase